MLGLKQGCPGGVLRTGLPLPRCGRLDSLLAEFWGPSSPVYPGFWSFSLELRVKFPRHLFRACALLLLPASLLWPSQLLSLSPSQLPSSLPVSFSFPLLPVSPPSLTVPFSPLSPSPPSSPSTLSPPVSLSVLSASLWLHLSQVSFPSSRCLSVVGLSKPWKKEMS